MAGRHLLDDHRDPDLTISKLLARLLADDVTGRRGHEHDPRRHEELAAALDRALTARANGANETSLAGHAAAFARERRGLVRVESLAEHVGVTGRQLQRLFLRDIGLSPKQFLRTIRFQEILRSLQGGGPPRWADLALRFHPA